MTDETLEFAIRKIEDFVKKYEEDMCWYEPLCSIDLEDGEPCDFHKSYWRLLKSLKKRDGR